MMRRQSGTSLIIVVILLVILMISAIALVRSSETVGAIAGNVMAIAFGLYGGLLHGIEPEYLGLFRVASLIVAAWQKACHKPIRQWQISLSNMATYKTKKAGDFSPAFFYFCRRS